VAASSWISLTPLKNDPSASHLPPPADAKEWDGKPVKKLVPVEHPVVRRHPETGRNALFVNPGFTVGIKGFNAPQSTDLLRLLYKHATQPELICRYRWQPGSFAFWDNRATIHHGPTDTEHFDFPRIMHRVMLAGDIPVGVDGRPSESINGSPLQPPRENAPLK